MSTGTEPLIYPTVTWVQVQKPLIYPTITWVQVRNRLLTLPLHEYRYETAYLPYRNMSTGTEPLIYPTVTWVQVQKPLIYPTVTWVQVRNRLLTLPLHEYRYGTAYLPYRNMSTGTEPLIDPIMNMLPSSIMLAPGHLRTFSWSTHSAISAILTITNSYYSLLNARDNEGSLG